MRAGLRLVAEVVDLGSSSATPPPTANPPEPTLTAIALSPLAISLGPGGTLQLTVTGRYSDGTTAMLPPDSGEVFQSSNVDAVTISVDAVATVATNARAGSTAAITATDTTSGLITLPADSTLVTVAASGVGPPMPSSSDAAQATARNNTDCVASQPFYWEIGDASSALAGGSSTDAGSRPVAATTTLPIASASKWIYGMYVVQQRGGAANLTAADIEFLTLTSGYTYMNNGDSCTAPASGANSINHCLTLPSMTPGLFFNSRDPTTVGLFAYGPGHDENHAGQFQPAINALDAADLGSAIAAGLGVSGAILRYQQPLLAGGVYASANDYTSILRAVLDGQLQMLDALGTHAVCAWTGSGCDAVYSPQLVEHWHYSIGHWVEDDSSHGDDGAFSSPGAFGFYPWIDSDRTYYGVVSRAVVDSLASAESAACGRALRKAWKTGVQQ